MTGLPGAGVGGARPAFPSAFTGYPTIFTGYPTILVLSSR